MCGIAGIYAPGQPPTLEELALLSGAIAHRGPDDEGAWLDRDAGVGLAHRRLSIIDLSAAGHQPMRSHGGRFTITFNGEIYNYRELQSELEASGSRQWQGHSDTEVLLEAFEAWGIVATLKRTNGMFAMAVWDSRERTLTLARDRVGEKPLAFGWVGGRFAFCSELSAFRVLPGWNPRIDADVAADFLRFGYVRGLHSIVRGIHRLPPACTLVLSGEDARRGLDAARVSQRIERYWRDEDSPPEIGTSAGFEAHAEYLEHLARESVSMRMIGDVPVGAFLSGGVDSSYVTALMQSQATQKVRTFSIGFREALYDESHHARRVAEHLGTDHTEFEVTESEAAAIVPQMSDIYDEPFGDTSQLPTVLLARLARRQVKVALSGDGGDELFAGYPRYRSLLKLWPWLRSLRGGGIPLRWLNRIAMPFQRHADRSALSARASRLVWRASQPTLTAFYDSFMADAPLGLLAAGVTVEEAVPDPATQGAMLQWAMRRDQVDYLPDNILVKLDRATMSVNLEGRIPLLDHRLLGFSRRLPPAHLFEGSTGKRLLRHLLLKRVPAGIIDRPKQGFGAPIAQWLRGALSEWAGDLLTPAELDQIPVLSKQTVMEAWADHRAGRADFGQRLWNILVFVAWKRRSGAAF